MTRSGDDGFTLVEVLMALAIFTLTLSALYRAMTMSLSAFRRAHEVDDVLVFATSELDQIRRHGLPAVRSGRLADGNAWQVREVAIPAINSDAVAYRWVVIDVGRDLAKPVLTLKTVRP